MGKSSSAIRICLPRTPVQSGWHQFLRGGLDGQDNAIGYEVPARSHTASALLEPQGSICTKQELGLMLLV